MVAPKSIAVVGAGCALLSIAVLSTYWVELSPKPASDTGRLLEEIPDGDDYGGFPTPPPFAPFPTPPPTPDPFGPSPVAPSPAVPPSVPGAVSTPYLNIPIAILNGLFFVIFWFTVVVKYRPLAAPNELSAQETKKNALTETCHVCCEPVCWTSYCCPTVRWAATLHAANILNFWIVMLIWAAQLVVSVKWPSISFFQCFLYCIPIAFTDLNEKLGGQRDNCCEACLCAFFCCCCVNVKYALALDHATYQEVGCLSVRSTEEGTVYQPIS